VDKASLQGVIKAHVRPHSRVCSDSCRDYDPLDLEGFRHVRICNRDSLGSGREQIEGIEKFWEFAKRRLKMYHGGFERNFTLFMREMELRFNHRDDPQVVEYLFELIKTFRLMV
jgi:transposase